MSFVPNPFLAELIAVAISSLVDSKTSTIIIKQHDPYWLISTGAQSDVYRFVISDCSFVDTFVPSVNLNPVFSTLHDLVPPSSVVDSYQKCKITDDKVHQRKVHDNAQMLNSQITPIIQDVLKLDTNLLQKSVSPNTETKENVGDTNFDLPQKTVSVSPNTETKKNVCNTDDNLLQKIVSVSPNTETKENVGDTNFDLPQKTVSVSPNTETKKNICNTGDNLLQKIVLVSPNTEESVKKIESITLENSNTKTAKRPLDDSENTEPRKKRVIKKKEKEIEKKFNPYRTAADFVCMIAEATNRYPEYPIKLHIKSEVLQSGYDATSVINAHILKYRRLGRKINSMAIEMGKTMPFQTKAQKFIDRIIECPGVTSRDAANAILKRAKWIYAIFRNIPDDVIKNIEGVTVRDIVDIWSLESRMIIVNSMDGEYKGDDSFPCWMNELNERYGVSKLVPNH
ncbi:hypothetical protein BC936DRAFT_141810 [Jimgerdemannia flammicorona]|uniref:Uncharacterized protein n=1 Tax=Jimgerdemannia flammicorona TaxID=994334 RepID=A0A433A1L6_9FUNG|nr:hypothetical protein BC936DRAFT_141810 [Jimgerdemannia flammicorona]